jgi:drug/metabolite transporter (DMT)-like permease
MEMLAGSAGLAAASMLSCEWTGFEISAVSLRSAAGLVYLITFGSLGALAAYTWLLRNAPTSLVSTYAFVNPMVAILLGTWLGEEPFSLHLAFAMSLIIGSVILVNRARNKNQEP